MLGVARCSRGSAAMVNHMISREIDEVFVTLEGMRNFV